MSEQLIYTVQEVAKMLHSSPNYIYSLIDKGFLPAIKLGSIKILKSTLEKFLLDVIRKIPIGREEIGRIRFSDKSVNEYISFSADRDKLLAAKQIPQFIKEGKLGEYFESPKDRSKQDTISDLLRSERQII